MDNILVQINSGPLAPIPHTSINGAGAVLNFAGIVRPIEQDHPILGLSYEVYSPMAENELFQLAQHIFCEFGLLNVIVQHSRGFVPNYQCSFQLQVASQHRSEALQAMEYFIDRMKQSVPIWKCPVLSPQPTATEYVYDAQL